LSVASQVSTDSGDTPPLAPDAASGGPLAAGVGSPPVGRRLVAALAFTTRKGHERMPLAEQFRQIVDDQAPSWSDLAFELELPDESRLDEARLTMAPAQLERTPGTRSHFTFRVSNTRGYGAHVGLVEACLRKLDDRLVPGTLDLQAVLHDVRPNLTQGPTFGRGRN
jgi:hypothetical protein